MGAWKERVDEPHTFTLNKDGLWWCDNEDVDADDCEDYTRCNHQCFCNKNRDEEEDEQEQEIVPA